jgi:hypothetical protein
MNMNPGMHAADSFLPTAAMLEKKKRVLFVSSPAEYNSLIGALAFSAT